MFKEMIAARQQSIVHYEFNIVNYRMALELLDESREGMIEFKEKLEGLLKTELIEQSREQLMLDVLILRAKNEST